MVRCRPFLFINNLTFDKRESFIFKVRQNYLCNIDLGLYNSIKRFTPNYDQTGHLGEQRPFLLRDKFTNVF